MLFDAHFQEIGPTASQDVISILVFDRIGDLTRLHIEYFLVRIVSLVGVFLHHPIDAPAILGCARVFGISFG